MDEIGDLIVDFEKCLAAIRAMGDALRERDVELLEFDGSNQGAKALAQLVQFTGNLTKAVSTNSLAAKR